MSETPERRHPPRELAHMVTRAEQSRTSIWDVARRLATRLDEVEWELQEHMKECKHEPREA